VAPFRPLPRFVAGVDAGFSEECQTVFAAAVVYDRERRTLAAVSHAVGRVEAPYVPGYLSFREGKAVLEAIGKLQHEFGVVLFDGQGYAHPRRCGIASHLSLLMDRPGVGVAKSRLVGTYDPAGAQAGSSTPLMDGEEQIGLVLRARAATLSRCLSVSRIAWTSSRPKNSFWLAASATVSPNRRV
jgi:deoxyribonuclease V